MTIFEFGLYRAARQKMTPAEVEICEKAAALAEAGEPGAAEMLRKMVLEVLGLRYTPQSAPKAQGAVE